MKILITGGTGTLGRETAAAAEAAGHTVRIGSRGERPGAYPEEREWASMKLADNSGIGPAVKGVDAIIHTASDPRQASLVDVEGTRRLVEAARDAGVRHIVYISIAGIDEIPFGYYQRKLEAEDIIARSGVPYSILRATQFHSLVDMLFQAAARVPLIMPLPTDFQVQSVAPIEVAARLARCLDDGPSGRLPDFGGPDVLTLEDAARSWKYIVEKKKPVVRIPFWGQVAAAFRAGKNTVRSGEHGVIRWEEWLLQRESVTGVPST